MDPLERAKAEKVSKPLLAEMELIGHLLEIVSINMTHVPFGFVRSVYMHLFLTPAPCF